jgi:hypothetical protein
MTRVTFTSPRISQRRWGMYVSQLCLRLHILTSVYFAQFMTAIFPETIISFFKGRSTSLFMLACGALVKTEESYSDLTDSAAS